MSTVQSYHYQAEPIDQEALLRRQQFEVESRRLEALNLRAQVGINQLNAQLKDIAKEKNRLASLDSITAANQVSLNQMERKLATTQTQLSGAKKGLLNQIQSLEQLHAGSECEKHSLQVAVEQTQSSLSNIERLSKCSLRNVETMQLAMQQGTEMSKQQNKIEMRLHEVETELRFLTHNINVQPAALIALNAMRENGYKLQEVESEGEMLAYFEHEERKYQIAVRTSSAIRTGENIKTWDILAETFNINGENCLFEIDDFETSVKEMGIGTLKRGNSRVYPKDERSKSKEKHGIISPLKENISKRQRSTKSNKEVVK